MKPLGFSNSCRRSCIGSFVSLFLLTCFFMANSVSASDASDDKIFSAPMVGKAFVPSTINAGGGTGGTTVLNITLSNPNQSSATIIGTFTDNLPLGFTVSGAASTTCGGSVSANNFSVTQTGGTIPANGSCLITVPLTVAFAGTYTDNIAIGSLQTSLGQNLDPACATLNVISTLVAPSVGKSFNPATVAVGGTSTLTITLSNPNTVVANITTPFIDILPTGIVVNPAGTVLTSCPGSSVTNNGISVTLTGGAIPAGGTCTITVPVLAGVAGAFENVVPGVFLQTSVGTGINAAFSTLSVVLPLPNTTPTVGKDFVPATVGAGLNSTLTITLTNPNAAAITVTAPFTDTLPAGLTTVLNTAATTCVGGVASQTPGSVTLTGGTIPASGSCTVTVTVNAALAGNFTNFINSGALVTSAGANITSIVTTLTVTSPVVIPSIGKSFSASTISQGGASTLTITLNNPNSTAATITAPFVDVLPSGPIYGTPTTTCTGSSVALSGSTLTLTGGSIPANGSCIISLPLSAPFGGNFTNNIAAGALVTSNGTSIGSLCVTLSVTPLVPFPSISKDFCPREICCSESSRLTITLFNPTPLPAVMSAPLVDMLPRGLEPFGHVSNTCGGFADARRSQITLSGGTIPAFGFCTISVEVRPDHPGVFTNSIAAGALQTNQGNNILPAISTLRVFEEEEEETEH